MSDQHDDRFDELLERLQAADPMPPGVPVDPPTSASARALLENIMTTPLDRRSPVAAPTVWWRRPAPLGAAAAVVVVAAIGIGVLAGGDDGPDDTAEPTTEPTTAPTEEATPLALTFGEGDPFASCAVFDVAVLATAPVAFGGTVTELADGSVTIAVDRWYKGGDATTVVLTTPAGFSPALDGIELTVGERYLLTSFDGSVSTCGLSGLATPELEGYFAEAFPS